MERIARKSAPAAPRPVKLRAVHDDDLPQPNLPTKCPLTAALNAIGGKWSLICLYWLDSGTRRFNELRRLMPDISHKVLTASLRNLEQEGLICRKVYAEVPPRVEYRISAHGESVLPILQAVRAWGHEHLAWRQAAKPGNNGSEPS